MGDLQLWLKLEWDLEFGLKLVNSEFTGLSLSTVSLVNSLIFILFL